ncbi:MAG: hypothetical protein H6977_13920 [Gammaproteobacteria bacterium]|nr:hypothetical protein [Gammaproteobacteria bacterium]MCP5201107.1 hypothetical protein [Gammaproteobacteria bacterium]
MNRATPRPWSGLVLVVAGLLLAQRAAAEHFAFAWPVPATAEVRSTVEKDGLVSTARYRIELAAAGDADELELSFEDFALLTLNGKDATQPEVAAALGPLAALTSALPSMRLSRSGDYRGVRGLNLVLQRVLELLPEDTPSTQRLQLERGLRSPRMQQVLQQKSGEIWNVWVGAWNGLDLAAGQQLEARVPLRALGGELEQGVTIEHLGAAPGAPGYVRLRMTTLVEGPELASLLAGFADALAASGKLEGGISGARSRSVTELVTRAADLVPRHAVSTTEVTVTDAAGHGFHQRERKEYWFEWP